jgi:hypothetical protein
LRRTAGLEPALPVVKTEVSRFLRHRQIQRSV